MLEVIHQDATEMFNVGSITEARMCEYKELFMSEVNETAAECIYGENCPLHSENPPFNAKVLAAIKESKAMMSGEIFADWFHSFKDARNEWEV